MNRINAYETNDLYHQIYIGSCLHRPHAGRLQQRRVERRRGCAQATDAHGYRHHGRRVSHGGERNLISVAFPGEPSGVAVTEGNLELDLQNSDTYLLVPPTRSAFSAQSRTSYVTPSDCYKITGVEPDRNGSGEILDGQWIVTIKTQGEGNFRNVSDLYLVMNYTDAAGVAHKVSSPVLPVQIVPTADEGWSFATRWCRPYEPRMGSLIPTYSTRT